MLPVRTVRLGDLAEDEAVRNQMRARARQFGLESDERLRASQGVNERLKQMGPLPGWPEPRPSPDPMPAGQPGPVGGQGGPENPMTPQQAAAAELERRKAARAISGGDQVAGPMTPQQAAAAELARRRGAREQINAPSLLATGTEPQGLPVTPALDEAMGRVGAPMAPNVNVLGDAMEQAAEWRPSQPQAFAGKLANSATFGTADKIFALPALLPGGNTYEEAQQNIRGKLGMMSEDYPVTSMAGEAAGFLAPGGVIAKGVNALARPVVNAAQRAGPTLGFLAKTANAALQGGAAGAAFGGTVGAENEAVARGEGSPGLPKRLETATAYAPGGAAFGAAMPAAGVAFRPVGRAIEGTVAKVGEALKLTPGATQRFNERVGLEAARRSLERSGIITIDDFLRRAAKYGDKPVVTGELGQDALNSLVSLTRAKGTTSEKAMAVLEDRVAGLPGRMLKDIADETGLKPDEVFGTLEAMVKAGRERAAPLYAAAEGAPFAETARLERIVQSSPILRQLLPVAKARVQNQATGQYGNISPLREGEAAIPRAAEDITHEAMPPLKVYDELKQLLDEEINKRIANGIGIEDVEGVRKALLNELDEISAEGADYLANAAGNRVQLTAPRASPYAVARDAGGDAPRIIAGQKAGERALSGARLAGDIEREVAAISGGELTAYQGGVIRNMVKLIENGALTPRRIKTKAFMDKLNSVFGEPAAQGLLRKFGIEAELMTKGARWNPNVGSVTSQAQMGGPSKIGDEIIRAGANALTGNKIGLAAQAINLLRRQGYSEKQLNAIGDILLSAPGDAAKRLYPGGTPTPGAIPPPVPPAGRVRQNTPHPPPALPQEQSRNPFLDFGPESIGAVGGAAYGAATTPEGENPLTRAVGFGAGAAGLVRGARMWGQPPVEKTQLNAFFPEPVGFRGGRPGRNPVGRKENFEPRDLVLAKNDNDGSYLDIGLSLGLDPNAVNVSSTINLLIQRVRTTIDRAAKVDGLDDLAKQWNVTRDELEKFQVRQQKSPFAGQTEAALSKAADIMETAAKNKQSISYDVVAQRLQAAGFKMTAGSLKSLMSAARTGATRGHSFSDALRERIRALPAQPAGRPYYANSPPELSGAMIGGITGAGAPADNPTDRLRNAGVGAVLGAGAGRLARSTGNKAPGARQSSIAAPRLAEVLPDDLIEDATTESLRTIQQQYIAAGQAPPVFKTFRMPDGRVVAWRSDGDFRGGMSHDQARDVLGLGNARVEHGQFKYGDDLSKTNWYGTSGEGPAPRSVESMMRKGAKEGRDPNDVLLDATPDEVLRDLRSIGAVGPGSKVGDYPYRRKLAMDTQPTETGVKWKTSGGKDAELYSVGNGEAMVGMSIDGKTMRTPNSKGIPVSESKETFEKAFAVIEREAIRKGQDAYFFSGASQGHNRLYLGALQRLGAPQGYVAIYNKDVGSFALMRPRYVDDLIAQGKIRPGEWTIIKSKRGDTPVPEWRRKTGQFAIPPVAALGVNGLVAPPAKAQAAIDRSRPIIENSDGSFSTERTITVQSPKDGRWYNVPTIIDGKEYSPEQVQQWFEDGAPIPTVGSFSSLDAAERAARSRSSEIGRVRAPDRKRPPPVVAGAAGR